jgi:hypothetical protein
MESIWSIRVRLTELTEVIMSGSATAADEAEYERVGAQYAAHPHQALSDEEAYAMFGVTGGGDTANDATGPAAAPELEAVEAVQEFCEAAHVAPRRRARRGSVSGNPHLVMDELARQSQAYAAAACDNNNGHGSDATDSLGVEALGTATPGGGRTIAELRKTLGSLTQSLLSGTWLADARPLRKTLGSLIAH